MTRVYYNDNEDYVCNWLANLMLEGLIPEGDIDGRSIRDVTPGDLRGYTQCHFFAGLGGWSRALQLAGWPSDREVWTGSCPCQPFSVAGKQKGFADERHLWPDFQRLIAERRPSVVFGEQVAGASAWINLVRSDLEALDYAVGCLPIEAASAGADHFRDRYFFVADGAFQSERKPQHRFRAEPRPWPWPDTGGSSSGRAKTSISHGELAHHHCEQSCQGLQRSGQFGGASRDQKDSCRTLEHRHDTIGRASSTGRNDDGRHAPGRIESDGDDAKSGFAGGSMEYRSGAGFISAARRRLCEEEEEGRRARDGESVGPSSWGGGWTEEQFRAAGFTAAGANIGDRQYLECPDGKWRRLPPPRVRWLGVGIPARVAKLRAIGNAIDPRPAAAFIKAYLECQP